MCIVENRSTIKPDNSKGTRNMKEWNYAFNCHDCGQIKYIDEGGNVKGYYCLPTREGRCLMHADDDHVLRCDDYQPLQMQMNLF